MPNVLVTGAGGFIGGSVCRALLGDGHAVTGLVRKMPAPGDSLPGVAYQAGDVADAASLPPGLLDGFDAVIHLVGIIVENRGAEQTFARVHVGGTENLVRAARDAGFAARPDTRFVYVSALGADLKAASEYSRTKALAEERVRSSGIPCTIFRPSVVLGKGGDFVRQMEGLIKRPPLTPFPLPFIPLPGRGANQFQPVWVDDLAAGVAGCLTRSETAGQTYEVGGADAVTFNQLLEGFERRLGVKKPLLHAPLPLMFVAASVLEALLPTPPVTVDQLLNLRRDNICDPAPFAAAFDRAPLGFEAILNEIYSGY